MFIFNNNLFVKVDIESKSDLFSFLVIFSIIFEIKINTNSNGRRYVIDSLVNPMFLTVAFNDLILYLFQLYLVLFFL